MDPFPKEGQEVDEDIKKYKDILEKEKLERIKNLKFWKKP